MQDTTAALQRRSLPFLVSCIIILADQISKALIVAKIPENTIGSRLLGDFLWIVHAKNLGIAFSLGDSFSQLIRIALFIVLPLGFIGFGIVYCFKTEKLSTFQRYAIAVIIGGGLGNLIDRIFRPDGVVDFISVKFYGLLGMDRFPTFNVADSCITIGAVLLFASGILWSSDEETER